MTGIIGTKNAGFTIIEAMRTSENTGYAIGKTENQYVVWWFCEGKGIDFYHGHYFPIDCDAPFKSRMQAKADYCRRLADTYENQAKYGY